MIFALGPCVDPLHSGLGLGLDFGLRFGFGSGLLGRRLGGMDKLRNAGLDGLVGRKLGLCVELEIALGPVEGVDHGVVAGRSIPLRVKQMPEQKVEGRRLAVSISDGKRTRGALTLSRLQQ